MQAKEAAAIASKYISEIIPMIPGTVMVEEIEKSGMEWCITLSYIPAGVHTGNWAGMLGGGREFKKFTIDDPTGEVTSMKIRQVRQ
jgi:hypothetical protein